MANEPTTIKGGKVRVMLGGTALPTVYTAPCGLSQRSVTLNKGLEEVDLPNCADPDAVSWTGRDATSVSMSISGEGVLSAESVDAYLDAFDRSDSVPVRVEWEFPAKTIVWTGKMHIESLEVGATNKQRASITISMQSDGEMVRGIAVSPPANVVSPSISGTAKVGSVLTANDGVWNGNPAAVLTRQWKANGANIASATGATYTPVSADVGKTITVTVTGTNSQGNSAATSGATTAVVA